MRNLAAQLTALTISTLTDNGVSAGDAATIEASNKADILVRFDGWRDDHEDVFLDGLRTLAAEAEACGLALNDLVAYVVSDLVP